VASITLVGVEEVWVFSAMISATSVLIFVI
jgi:hypothetical protein